MVTSNQQSADMRDDQSQKLTAPATAVETLASKTAVREITILVRFTLIPSPLAVLSSRDSRLHSPTNKIARNSPAST